LGSVSLPRYKVARLFDSLENIQGRGGNRQARRTFKPFCAFARSYLKKEEEKRSGRFLALASTKTAKREEET
jgi:hypothetical protein